MSMMNKTGKRKAKALKRDKQYLRDFAAAMSRCMGEGIFNLFQRQRPSVPDSEIAPQAAPGAALKPLRKRGTAGIPQA